MNYFRFVIILIGVFSQLSYVKESPALEDTTPPQVTAFSITPKTFNTESSDQVLTLTITVTDDLSGLDVIGLGLYPQTGSQVASFESYTRISGDDLNGTYTATVIIPKGSATGTWTAGSLYLRDNLGNIDNISPTDLNTLFGADSTEFMNLASIEDTTPPQVTAFSITPKTFNTESSDQVLTLTITVTDNLSGLDVIGLGIYPLIGTQTASFESYIRISGDDLNGTYTATATIPAYAKQGIWEVGSLYLRDNLGNINNINATDLNAMFGGDSLTPVNTANALSVEVEREWNFTSSTATVDFSPGTIVTKKEGGEFAFYQMVNKSVNIEELPIETPDGLSFLHVLKFGIPEIGLEFSQPVNIIMNAGEEFNGQHLQILTLTEGENDWSEESTCIVTQCKCSFYTNHASYFSTIPGNGFSWTLFLPTIISAGRN